jgi:uncharacterized membrane protein YfcA
VSLTPIAALLASLGALTLFFIQGWYRAVRRQLQDGKTAQPEATDARMPSALHTAIGAVTNFFDTLGIGSFATTTSMFRAWRLVPDRIIPGTLNVGHTLPTVVQAFIYTTIVQVEVGTLIGMIAAAVVGAWLGAGVVARWSKRKVQIGMGSVLLVAAAIMAIRLLSLAPVGTALGVSGGRFVIAITVNFVLGALMTLGIGLYAPCLILVGLLGMNPTAAFPIMMGSCAFLMPVGSLRFIREQAYSLRAALGLALGGIPAVLVAAFIVKSLPLRVVSWVVVVVVVYTALSMLYSALGKPSTVDAATVPEAIA